MCCKECGSPYTERHHCVFRSQSTLMIDMEINFKDLCNVCHRGKDGPHLNRKKDLQYKVEVQKKLQKVLCKKYYTVEGMQKALKISFNKVKKIIKTLQLHKEGYSSEEIIRLLMGGKIYLDDVVEAALIEMG